MAKRKIVLSFIRPKGSLGRVAQGPSGTLYMIRRSSRVETGERTCYYIATAADDGGWNYRINGFNSYDDAKQRCLDNETGIDPF